MSEESVVSLNERRAMAHQDSGLWSPLECLEALVRDIKAGKVSPEALVVHWYEPQPGGGSDLMQTNANMTYEAELALLTLATHNCIENWRRS